MPDKMHLAWFMNFTPDEWNDPFAAGGNPWDGESSIDMARVRLRPPPRPHHRVLTEGRVIDATRWPAHPTTSRAATRTAPAARRLRRQAPAAIR
jgi:hypothetical protein